MSTLKSTGILLIFTAILIDVSVLAQNSRQNPQDTTKPGSKPGNITCGSSTDDLAMQVQTCAKPLMDILEGSIEKWPRNEKDAADLCNSFAGAEKCMRVVARQCATGLQKTIISTVANSVQRARKRECSKSKYPAVLKMTQCIEKHQSLVHSLITNATDRLTVVHKKMEDLDQRMSGVCCMVHEIENNIRVLFVPKCPTETLTIIQLYRAVLEDVLELICRSPKCKDIFRGYTITKNAKSGGIISALLQIIFSLG